MSFTRKRIVFLMANGTGRAKVRNENKLVMKEFVVLKLRLKSFWNSFVH